MLFHNYLSFLVDVNTVSPFDMRYFELLHRSWNQCDRPISLRTDPLCCWLDQALQIRRTYSIWVRHLHVSHHDQIRWSLLYKKFIIICCYYEKKSRISNEKSSLTFSDSRLLSTLFGCWSIPFKKHFRRPLWFVLLKLKKNTLKNNKIRMNKKNKRIPFHHAELQRTKYWQTSRTESIQMQFHTFYSDWIHWENHIKQSL